MVRKGIRINVQFVVNLWGAVKVDERNKKVRNFLKDIGAVKEFEELLSGTMLSEEERKIIDMIYHEHKTFGFVADTIGISESSLKRKHRKILIKIGKVIGEM